MRHSIWSSARGRVFPRCAAAICVVAGLAVALVSGCDEDESPPLTFEPPDPWVLDLNRDQWSWASLPAEPSPTKRAQRRFQPAHRAFARWHRPVPAVLWGGLNPSLPEHLARRTVNALQVRLESNHPTAWQPEEYAGLMHGLALEEWDVSEADHVEFWINDFTGDPNDPSNPRVREGILHFDFGVINEDFWWPRDLEDLTGYDPQFDTEDTDDNLTLGPRADDPSRSEDTGLDGLCDDEGEVPFFPQRPPRSGDPAGDNFDAAQGEEPFLYLNGTEANQKLDSEDLNFNGRLDDRDGYFTLSLDLADADAAVIDVYRDYDDPEYADFLAAERAKGSAWRLIVLDLVEAEVRQALSEDPYFPIAPDLGRVRSFRIWYENPNGTVQDRKPSFVIAGLRFAEDPKPD